MIHATGLSKNFKIYKKKPGFLQSIYSLFHREYQITSAVSHFDLDVSQGEIIGLLGPNGAGKTTLMKMFTGIIHPSKGDLTVLGHRPAERSKDFRRKIALVMGQKSQLWWDIPAMDSFLLLQKFYEIPEGQFRKKMDYLCELLDVKKLIHVHVRKLSLGERMKLELMASLLHEPEVVFLDEPTIGLDVIAQKNIRQFLRQYQKEHGTTIILTSHYMADVEALCSRIVLILEGQKYFDGPIQNFENLLGFDKIGTVHFASPQDPKDLFWRPLHCQWKNNNQCVEIKFSRNDISEIGSALFARFPVVDFSTSKMPIENVVSELIEKSAPRAPR